MGREYDVDHIEEREQRERVRYTHPSAFTDEERQVLRNDYERSVRANPKLTDEQILAEFTEMMAYTKANTPSGKKTSPKKKPNSTPAAAATPSKKKTDTDPSKSKPKKKENTLKTGEGFARLKEITRVKKEKETFEKGIIKYYKGVKTAYLRTRPSRREKESARSRFKHFENHTTKKGLGWGSPQFVSQLKSQFPDINWQAEAKDFNKPAEGTEASVSSGSPTPSASSATPSVTAADSPVTTSSSAAHQSEGKKNTPVEKGTTTPASASPQVASQTQKTSSSSEDQKAPSGSPLKINKPASTEQRVSEVQSKTDGLPKAQTELTQNSDDAFQKGVKKVNQASRKVQKTQSAAQKTQDAQKAVLPPKEESIGEANTKAIDAVQKAPEPQLNPNAPKQSVSENLKGNLPRTEADVKALKETNHAKNASREMNTLIKGQTQGVKNNYKKIADAPAPVAKTAEKELPGIEAPPKIENLNLQEGMLPAISTEQTDFSEYSKASDDLVKNELQSPEMVQEFETSDAKPFVEARTERDGIKTDVEKAPQEIRVAETTEKQNLGKNLDQEEKKAASEMVSQRQKQLVKTHDTQKKGKNQHEEERKRVSQHINKIYETANSRVKDKLDLLELRSMRTFEEGQHQATLTFKKGVEDDLEAFFAERHSGVSGFFTSIGDWWSGTDDLPEVQAIFNKNKDIFVETIDQLIDTIMDDAQNVIDDCKTIISDAREEIEQFKEGLEPSLLKHAENCQREINEKLDQLMDETVKREQALQEKMAELREQAIASVDKIIEERKEKMKGALSKLGGFLLDLAIKFFTFTMTKMGLDPKQVMNMINKGVQTLTSIVTSPLKFFSNLAGAVNQGLTGFQTNFKKHMMTGMIQWLTGAMGGVIDIPQSFDMKSMLKLGFSVLGLTWMNLRKKLAKQVGEPVIEVAEKGFEVIQILRNDGVSGLWEYIQAEAAAFKDTVIEGIKNWALTAIVKNAIIQIALMLNPAGAIVKAIISIYDLVMWLINNIQRIISFVNSVVNSVAAIAAGQIGAAAAFIENAMATTIPMILSGLAQFLKLGGIAKRIKTVIAKVRAPIDKAVTKGINSISKKVKGWFSKSKGGKKKVSKKQVEKDDKLTLAEKKKKVSEGLRYLHQQENKYDKDGDGKLTKDDASKIAKKTKSKYSIFQWIKVVLKGGKWGYRYKYNPEDEEKSNKDADNGKPTGIEKWKKESAGVISKIEALLKKDESVKRDFEHSLKIVKGDWKDYVDLVKDIKNDQDEKDIIDGFKDVLKQAEELKELVNKRVPDEEKVDDERAIVLELLSRATHVPPRNYRNGKHWVGNTRDSRIKGSKDGDVGGAGQFLESYSDSDVEKLEKEAIRKGRIVKHSNSTYHFFYNFSHPIGYANGEKVSLLRAEITGVPTTPTIHSHPR